MASLIFDFEGEDGDVDPLVVVLSENSLLLENAIFLNEEGVLSDERLNQLRVIIAESVEQTLDIVIGDEDES